jgi:hypothetical protein
MNTKPISHFSLLGPNAYSTSVLMGNRAFIRMWAARRAAKASGQARDAFQSPLSPQPAHSHSALGR